MTIGTKNGSVILKSGSVAQNCGCCKECLSVSFGPYFGPPDRFPRGVCYGAFFIGSQTVSFSGNYLRRITITGAADDDIAIDGVPVGQPCKLSGIVSHSFCLSANSFVVAAVDNYGWPATYNLTICSEQCVNCSECNPLP